MQPGNWIHYRKKYTEFKLFHALWFKHGSVWTLSLSTILSSSHYLPIEKSMRHLLNLCYMNSLINNPKFFVVQRKMESSPSASRSWSKFSEKVFFFSFLISLCDLIFLPPSISLFLSRLLHAAEASPAALLSLGSRSVAPGRERRVCYANPMHLLQSTPGAACLPSSGSKNWHLHSFSYRHFASFRFLYFLTWLKLLFRYTCDATG